MSINVSTALTRTEIGIFVDDVSAMSVESEFAIGVELGSVVAPAVLGSLEQ
ncbi:hypothetical protein [Fibrobacter sp.]|uniref:hypothetical protein n=1 Tax=Fibrobacter sp. TaxID=35828 RepID=UPI0038647658